MEESILTSIKKLLGITEDYTQFDTDIMLHINSVFAILNQLNIGPEEGFSINDKESKWNEFIDNEQLLQSVISDVYFRVRLMFDPPTNSALLDSFKKQIDELEWRMNITAESL